MSDPARPYVELAHAIALYIPGYIDGYFGPEEWKTADKRPLEELAENAEALAQAVEALEDKRRRSFLKGFDKLMALGCDTTPTS